MGIYNPGSGNSGSGVNSVTASAPLQSSGGANPNISFIGGAIGGSIQSTQIAYGSGVDTITGDNSFIRTISEDRFQFGGTVSPSNGIFYNGTGAPNPLGNHAGLGLDFRVGTAITTLGWVGVGSGTHIEISDSALRVDLYTQDFYIRGYDTHVGFFNENTSTYNDVYLGDNSLTNTQTRLQVRSSDAHIVMSGVFGNSFDADMSVNYTVSIGALGIGNGTKIVVSDSISAINSITDTNFSVLDVALTEWFRVGTGNSVHATTIGDVNGIHNSTKLVVDDIKESIELTGGTYYHGAVHVDSAVTTAYTVQPQDQIIYVDTTTAVVTITLPSIITNDHRRITIKDMGNASVNNIFIVAAVGVVNNGIMNVDGSFFTWQAANFNNVWYHVG